MATISQPSPAPSAIQPYVFFRGRCEEAINYYKAKLDAEVSMLMRFSDNPEKPPRDKVPAAMDDKVMHAEISIAGASLMLADGMKSGAIDNQAMSLSLSVSSDAEADRIFNALATDGKVEMPLGPAFFAKRFGAVVDKFGISWMIMTPAAASGISHAQQETAMTSQKITISTTTSATVERAWQAFTTPAHITQWNFANDDWCCPSAAVDLRLGGAYKARMEAKDKSFGFDFEAVYEEVVPHKAVMLAMSDGRKARTTFEAASNGTKVTTVFDAETQNSTEMQRSGWQAILDNFRRHVDR